MSEVILPNEEVFSDLTRIPTLMALKKRIGRLDISADQKAILIDIAKVTVKVGSKVLAIGRKVLDVVLALFRLFPNMVFGAIAALVLTALIAAIPIFGGMMASLLSTLILAFGVGTGFVNEMMAGGVGDRVDLFVQSVSKLVGEF